MLCPKCGTENSNSPYCTACGENLQIGVQGAVAPPAQPQSPVYPDPAQPVNQQPVYQQPQQPQQPVYQQPQQPVYQQPVYQQPQQPYGQQFPVQPQAPYGQPYMPVSMEPAGEKAATGSLVCGIISLFCAGFILGIIAIVQGNKAKKLGYSGGKATAGIVLGVIGLIGWALVLTMNIVRLAG